MNNTTTVACKTRTWIGNNGNVNCNCMLAVTSPRTGKTLTITMCSMQRVKDMQRYKVEDEEASLWLRAKASNGTTAFTPAELKALAERADHQNVGGR